MTDSKGFAARVADAIFAIRPLILLIYVNASGLLVVCAMGFTLVQMHRNRELIALLAGGVSMYRIAAPILVAGFVLNIASFPLQEAVIPAYADKLARSKSHLKLRTGRNYPVWYAVDSGGSLLSAGKFINTEGRLEMVTLLRRDADGSAVGRITADEARWVESYAPDAAATAEDRANAGRAGWLFPGGGGYAVSVVKGTGHGVADYQPTPVQFVPSALSPRVLMARRATMLPKFLSIRELHQMRDNPAVDARQRGKLTLNIWSRFSIQVVNVLILVMGLPFFLLRRPKNLMGQAVKAAGICVGAWGNGLVMLAIGGGLPPVLVAWLPVVIYLPIATILLLRVET